MNEVLGFAAYRFNVAIDTHQTFEKSYIKGEIKKYNTSKLHCTGTYSSSSVREEICQKSFRLHEQPSHKMWQRQ